MRDASTRTQQLDHGTHPVSQDRTRKNHSSVTHTVVHPKQQQATVAQRSKSRLGATLAIGPRGGECMRSRCRENPPSIITEKDRKRNCN